jgi:hypothetical protein
MKKVSIEKLVIHDTNLRAGLAKNHKKGDKFVVGGKEITIGDLCSLLDGRVQAAQDLDVKRREHSAAVETYRATVAESKSVVSGVRTQLISQLGATAPALSDYGIPPRKTRQVPSVEERAKSVAKSRATREARHTMGPKERLDIKGTVPADVPPPPTEGSAGVLPAHLPTEGSAGVLPARLPAGATNGAPTK